MLTGSNDYRALEFGYVRSEVKLIKVFFPGQINMISNNLVTHEDQLCAESDCQTLPYIPVSKSNPAEKRSKHRKKKTKQSLPLFSIRSANISTANILHTQTYSTLLSPRRQSKSIQQSFVRMWWLSVHIRTVGGVWVMTAYCAVALVVVFLPLRLCIF